MVSVALVAVGVPAGIPAAAAVTPWPEARNAAAVASDGTALVLFGGQGVGRPLNDTWAWNGTTWKHKVSTASPPARSDATMAPDGTGLVLFGGKGDGGLFLGDTWTWGGKPQELDSADAAD